MKKNYPIVICFAAFGLCARAQTNVFPTKGNAGIGTTAPDKPLVVRSTVTTANTQVTELANAIADQNFHLVTTRGAATNNTGDIMTRIGLVYGGNGLGSQNNGFIRFHRGGLSFGGDISFSTTDLAGIEAERMRLTALGKIGIGTSLPQAKLDIAGNIRINDGTQGAGKVLTADATGLASWQAPALVYWAASGNNLYNSNSGNVGIGTNAPAAKLDIKGDALVNGVTVGLGPGNNPKNPNLAFGISALAKHPGDGDNTALGNYALANHTSTKFGGRDLNTAVGAAALYHDTAGQLNTALGYGTLLGNIYGSNNTALGATALYVNNGSNNTATGLGCLYNNTTGSNNSALGYYAGQNNLTGQNLTFLGSGANVARDGLTNATAIGANAVVGTSNSLVLGNNANVGIGTSTPLVPFQVSMPNGNFLVTPWPSTPAKTVLMGNFIGKPHMAPLVRFGSDSSASFIDIGLDSSAGFTVKANDITRLTVTKAGNVGIGTTTPHAGLEVTNAAIINGPAVIDTTADNTTGNMSIGKGSAFANVKLYVQSTQAYGVVVDAPLAKNAALFVNGMAVKPGGGGWAAPSDKNLKTNVIQYKDGLEQLLKINPVKFHYNAISGYNTEKEYVGVIAQDIQQVAPYMVGKFTQPGETQEYLSVDNSAITYMMVNAFKELKVKNDAKDLLISNQQQQIATQQQMLASQQQQINTILQKLADLETLQAACCNAANGKNQANSQNVVLDNNAAALEQNQPNPFNQTTVIKYHLPSGVNKAQMLISDLSGHMLKTINLSPNGDGQVSLAAGTLAQGNYIYSLLVDGKRIDAKQMVLVK